MALTREVGTQQLTTQQVTLTAQQPWAPLVGSDIERRGALVYVDPAAPGPAYLADTEAHAASRSNGAPMYPQGFPPGFELGVTAAAYAYATDDVLAIGEVTVYVVVERGQAFDH